jgi:hypothetical protein
MLWNGNLTSTSSDRIVDEYFNNQKGIALLEVSEWNLPYLIINIQYTFSLYKKITVIEKFIIKTLQSPCKELHSIEAITSLLRLHDSFIRSRIQQLYANGLLEIYEMNEQQPLYRLTDKGIEAVSKNELPVKEMNETLTLGVEPLFGKLFYANSPEINQMEKSQSNVKNFRYYSRKHKDETLKHFSDLNEQDIYDIQEKLGRPLRSPDSICAITHIQSRQEARVGTARYLEFWIYDQAKKEVYCRVWDFQQSTFRKDIEEYIFSKEKKQKETLIKTSAAEGIEKLHDMRIVTNKAESQKLDPACEVEMLRGSHIRDAFLKTFKETKKKLLIITPWISEKVVDNELLQLFQEVAMRGASIHIGWGIAKEKSQEDRLPSKELLVRMQSIKDKQGNQAVFVHWIGNHHNKEIVVDNKYHLLGSFNWLSYRGDYNLRNESVYKVSLDKHIRQAIVQIETDLIQSIESEINEVSVENKIMMLIRELLRYESNTKKRKEILKNVINRSINNNNYDLLNKIRELLKDKNEFQNEFKLIEIRTVP